MADPKELAYAIVKGLDDKKGKDIKMLATADLTTLADYFVICTATSNTQARALSDAAEEAAEKVGETPDHIEGRHNGNWMLLDFSSVVVHIFTNETREFYGLERLWADAAEVDLKEILDQPKK